MSFDYTELDNEILSMIKEGVTEYGAMLNRSKAPIDRLCKGGRYRAIDKRLQALRRKGRISYSKSDGWAICS